MSGTIYSIGYGILKGTHEERKVAFQKRLKNIRLGIGKPITIVDIRKYGSGSRNGMWFRQRRGFLTDHMGVLVNEVERASYIDGSGLANHHGATLKGLRLYARQLERSLRHPIVRHIAESLWSVTAIAEQDERAVVLLCGCKQAFKKNGTTWNCHRVPLADALVKVLGPGWDAVHI